MTSKYLPATGHTQIESKPILVLCSRHLLFPIKSTNLFARFQVSNDWHHFICSHTLPPHVWPEEKIIVEIVSRRLNIELPHLPLIWCRKRTSFMMVFTSSLLNRIRTRFSSHGKCHPPFATDAKSYTLAPSPYLDTASQKWKQKPENPTCNSQLGNIPSLSNLTVVMTSPNYRLLGRQARQDACSAQRSEIRC